ncbi:hypothetical protein Q8A73_000224 [Channa argus]|nr:hypothetical protein Q8A73_000224 [Channa argus]
MELVFLFIFFPVTYSVKHSLRYFFTTCSGLQSFPEYVAVSKIDGVQVGCCDSINLTVAYKPDWVKKLNKEDPQHLDWQNQACRNRYHHMKTLLEGLKQHFNQTEGVHILQRFSSCEWDDETGETNVYIQFGYDGEDFVSLDPKNQRWLFSEQAATYKDKWDPDKTKLYYNINLANNYIFPWLKKYLTYGKSYLLRKVSHHPLSPIPPSVSLLQKSPSSPVSCHATGFYPDRATMFWRKDGEELHEDVDHGEILPNHDGTFQMRVDLNISSVKPEDWRRYDCVFQLPGVKDDIVTKLDKAVIRTNREKTGMRSDEVPPSQVAVGAVIGVVVALMLLTVCITGLFIWRKKKNNSDNGFQPANTSESNTNSAPTVTAHSED